MYRNRQSHRVIYADSSLLVRIMRVFSQLNWETVPRESFCVLRKQWRIQDFEEGETESLNEWLEERSSAKNGGLESHQKLDSFVYPTAKRYLQCRTCPLF